MSRRASDGKRRFLIRPRRFLLLAMLPIGDTMLITPTIRALRERHPDAHIVALATPTNAPLLERLGLLDKVETIDTSDMASNLSSITSAIYKLRKQKFDVSIDFTSPAFKFINFLCGIPVRTYMKFPHLWWLLPRNQAAWRNTHAAQHYYNCARELDLPPWSEVNHTPIVHTSADDRAAANAFLREAMGTDVPRHLLVGIHPGGAGLGGKKRWPVDRFAELAARLKQNFGTSIVLLGGVEDKPLAEEIARSVGDKAVIVAGEAPLMTSLAVLERCDLLIGNDSSLLHGAAALGVPYVGVFGVTHAPNFQPVPQRPGQGVIVQPKVPCAKPQYFVGGSPLWYRPCTDDTCGALARISVETVYAEALRLIGSAEAHEAIPDPSPLA